MLTGMYYRPHDIPQPQRCMMHMRASVALDFGATFGYFQPIGRSHRVPAEAAITIKQSRGPRGSALTTEVLGQSIEVTRSRAGGARRGVLAKVWVALLLAILGFLVIYPVLTLLLGALTDTNPVVDGINLRNLSVVNFLTVLTNPNVAEALFNTLVACGGGTVIAVVIGLLFSWIVVRTNTPFKGFIAAASILPLFAPPLVAGVAWSILGSPRTGLINTVFKWMGLDWHVNFYSLSGLVFVFGIYYAPYVYMFTSSALRNMDPSLEEAAEISGASAFTTLFTVTFPLIMPAIVSGMLLSFIVMLGIYGVPAVLGAPANLNVLTTYIFKLTNWTPPLYNTAAAVAIILMVVTGVLVYLQQKVLSGKSFTTVAGKAFRPRSLDLGPWRWLTFALGVVYLLIVVVLPMLALIVAAFRKFLFIRDVNALFDMRAYSLMHFNAIFDNPLTMRSVYNAVEVGVITAVVGGALAFAIGYTIHRTTLPGRRAIDLISTVPVAIPGPRGRRRLSLGLDRRSRRALRHHLDPCARFHRPLHARHGQGLIDLVPADPSRARGGGLGLRQGYARHHPHRRAAAGAAGCDRLDDAAVRARDPRARFVAVPLHQQHHGDVGAAARLLRGRQCRQDRRFQSGADGAARRADRRRQLFVAPGVARRHRARNKIR